MLEKGRIVERGTHVQLHAKGGRYREMYDRQHGVVSNLFLAPGEGGESDEPETEEPAAAGAAAAPASRLGLIDP